MSSARLWAERTEKPECLLNSNAEQSDARAGHTRIGCIQKMPPAYYALNLKSILLEWEHLLAKAFVHALVSSLPLLFYALNRM